MSAGRLPSLLLSAFGQGETRGSAETLRVVGDREPSRPGRPPRADLRTLPWRSPRGRLPLWTRQRGLRRPLSSSLAPDPGLSVRAFEYTLTLGPPGGWGALARGGCSLCTCPRPAPPDRATQQRTCPHPPPPRCKGSCDGGSVAPAPPEQDVGRAEEPAVPGTPAAGPCGAEAPPPALFLPVLQIAGLPGGSALLPTFSSRA